MADADYHGYPDGIPQPPATGGLELLRKRRGDERITFADVADRIADFVKLNKPSFGALDAFAKYLADGEDLRDDREVPRESSVETEGGSPEPEE